MSRGDRREVIFLDDEDRRCFLKTLEEACEKTGWQVHAFCLMGNHFHFVVETPRANLCSGMHWLLGTYTARFNRRHKMSGHVFAGRYKAQVVDGSGNGYLKTGCDYVHLNPTRAGLLLDSQRLREFPWSSYPEYLKPPGRRKKWLRTDRLLGEWGIGRDDARGRSQFEHGMEQCRRLEEAFESEDWKRLRRGWCVGDDKFREKLLEMVEAGRHEHHRGEELRESDEQKAERIVRGTLAQSSCEEGHLSMRRKSDPLKVRIASRLRKETGVSWKWIAQRLRMGKWRSAANAVRSGAQCKV